MSDNTNNGFPVPEEPLTREEQYLSAIAGVTEATEIPEKPLTRVEAYLNEIVENGGGGGGGATVNNATITIQKNGTTVDSFTSNQATDKTINITVPTSAADVSALPDTTKYAAALSLTINSSTFVMTGQLIDQDGNDLGTAQTIDLPLESVVVNGSYNSQTKKVVLTLQNGNTIEFSVADLVSGLQTELSASNKLNPAYINYDSTHRAVSDTEKSTWNSKQNAIDSSHKLSADLVDDTNATNKFATAEELEQIQTNKNNILWANNYGYKNLIKRTKAEIKAANPNISWTGDTSNVVGGLTFTINDDLSITINGTTTATVVEFNLQMRSEGKTIFKQVGEYRIDGKMQAGYGMFAANRTVGSSGVRYGADEGETATFTVEQSDLSASVGLWWGYNGVVGKVFDNITIYPMICLSTMDRTYQPYCPSNYELYQMILNL